MIYDNVVIGSNINTIGCVISLSESNKKISENILMLPVHEKIIKKYQYQMK